MSKPLRSIGKLARLCALACVAVAALPGQQASVRIGIVMDGHSEQNDVMRQVFEEEIAVLLEGEFDAQFPAEKRLVGDWTAGGVERAVDQLLADPEVDHVLALGILSSAQVSRRGPLPKPVYAAVVLDPQLQGIPYEARELSGPGEERQQVGVSGVRNLSYVTLGVNFFREVEVYREVTPFSRLAILYLEALKDEIPSLADRVSETLRPQNVESMMVEVGDSLDEALAKIPPNADAVLVSPLRHLSTRDFDRLAKALIDRKLPSFSSSGRVDVEKGLLATLWPSDNYVRRARRVALNLQQVLLGEPAADLPVEFYRQESLSINMATARAIGVSPTFKTMTEAELLNEEPTRAARTVSLSEVVREASMVNLDLAAADRNVAAGLRLVKEARGRLLPQLGINGSASFIDKDRADEFLGLNPERRAAAGAELNQLIYSDEVKSAYDIERNLQDLRAEERAQLRLDVVLEASESYLNVLRSKTTASIQKDNLLLSRSNLALAQARVEIGQAGREEVFRWESQIAGNRKDVVDSDAVRRLAEIAVNRVLNRALGEFFFTVEAGLNDPELVTSFEQIRPYIETPDAFRVFRSFMVRGAFSNSPELRQLDAAILAQGRELTASRRAFYVPQVGFTANVEYFGRGGVGSKQTLPFPFANQTNWNLFVNGTLPLFQGGAMRARRGRAEIQLDELTIQQDATRQRIEERMRSILHSTQATFVGIDLTRDAADTAHRNLELVTEQYAEGIVDILRLLDAQNQALVADLAAANAVFDYLTDLMGAQRALGRFDYYLSAEDRQDFLNRLQAFFDDAGQPVRQ